MPLARYFFFVGGLLLTLLFVVDLASPKLPSSNAAGEGSEKAFKSVLRINSDRKWPERIVFDTSAPPVVPAPAARVEEAAATQVPVTNVPAKAREALAQFVPVEQRRLEPKPHRKRKLAERHIPPRAVVVAQQPRFGFFVRNFW